MLAREARATIARTGFEFLLVCANERRSPGNVEASGSRVYDAT
jgi:hypothetical protein